MFVTPICIRGRYSGTQGAHWCLESLEHQQVGVLSSSENRYSEHHLVLRISGPIDVLKSPWKGRNALSTNSYVINFKKNGKSPKTAKKSVSAMAENKRAISKRGVRQKGHSFEREIAIALRVVFPNARRHLENHKDDAAKGIDIVGTGVYKIQCKRLRKPAPLSMIKQVKCNELLGDVPVLITKGDNDRILACLPFEEFLRLLRQAGV